MFNVYQGRHRRPTVPSLTAEALVDLWAGDLFRHFEDPMPFGVRGPGRSIGDAAELARIDMRDRMAVSS